MPVHPPGNAAATWSRLHHEAALSLHAASASSRSESYNYRNGGLSVRLTRNRLIGNVRSDDRIICCRSPFPTHGYQVRQATKSTPKRRRLAETIDARAALLRAAEDCLRQYGYGALSTRQVALAANVPLSQIHYYFQSKEGLVLALFESLNERLLRRQSEMFHDDSPLWRQWDLACDFLDQDLDSGFVRILHELVAVGWSNPLISGAVKTALMSWQALLLEVAQRASQRLGGFGPLAPEDVAALVNAAFLGSEVYILMDGDTPALPVRRALRRMGKLIRHLEETATTRRAEVRDARKTSRPGSAHNARRR